MNEDTKLELTWGEPKGHGAPEPCLTFEVFDKAKGTNLTCGAVFEFAPRQGARAMPFAFTARRCCQTARQLRACYAGSGWMYERGRWK